MNFKNILMTAATAALLGACAEADVLTGGTNLPVDHKIRVSADIAGSRAGLDNGNLSGFGLIIENSKDAAYCYNVEMSENGGQWAPADGSELLWDKAFSTVRVCAFAPYRQDVTLADMEVSTPVEYKSADEVAAADLVMMSCDFNPQTDLDANGRLNITLTHKLSKLYINLSDKGTDVSDVKVEGLLVKGTIRLSETAAPVNATGTVSAITPYDNGNRTFECIVVPQTVKELVINYKADGRLYRWRAATDITFTEGTTQSIGFLEPIETYHVMPEATGNGTGRDWENAMGCDNLVKLLNGNLDLSDKTILLGEGTFKIDARTEFKGTNVKLVKGAGMGKTILVPTNPDEDYPHWFVIGTTSRMNFADLTFDGRKSRNAAAKLRGFWVEGTSYTEFKNVEFTGFNNTAGESYATVFKSKSGDLRFNGCVFRDNVVGNRGLIDGRNEAKASIFLNNCLFKNNHMTGGSYSWGSIYQGSATSVLLINNSAFVNNTMANAESCFTLNTDGDMIIVNSTFYNAVAEGHPQAFIRGSSDGQRYLGNNLFNDCSYSAASFQKDGNANSLGFNIWHKAHNWNFSDNDCQYTELQGTVDADGNVVYTVPDSMTSFATLQSLKDALAAATTKNRAEEAMVQKFIDWTGEDFGKDRTGNTRNVSKLKPGAHDTGL